MTADEIETLAAAFFSAIERGDVDEVRQMYAPDARVWHNFDQLEQTVEAIATLDREKVDLVLSDVRLSGTKSGLEVAHEARQRGIPLLFVTGHPPDNACDLALGCLLKPYNDRTLKAALSAIDKLLGGGSPKPPKGLTLYSPKADTSAST